MDSVATQDWTSRNQGDLADELAEIKALLRAQAARHRPDSAGDGDPPDLRPDQPPTDGRSSRGDPSETGSSQALDSLCDAFGLSPFERKLLLLCAGIELDSEVAPLCAVAQGDPSRNYPTFSLALAMLPEAHWSALSPVGPLRHWRLIEVDRGPALVASPVRIEERVLHHLVGISYLDERLAAMTEPVPRADPGDLAASQAAVAGRIAAAWSSPRGRSRAPSIQLFGPGAGDRRAVAAAAAAAIGLRVALLPAELIPGSAAELDALARLWEREAALGSVVLLVECDDGDAPALRGVRRLAERISGLAIVSDRERRSTLRSPTLGFAVLPPTPAEQRTAWRATLGSAEGSDPGMVDAIAAHFNLGLPTIRAAAAESVACAAGHSGADLGHAAWDVCRDLCRSRLDDLARRVEPAASWEDLVLPGPQIDAVRRIAQHVRHKYTVNQDWGFAARSARGLGISALFAGASGTGKSMAAEVLACELQLDLYRVDLAGVVSKYIGETEKNLRRVFDAAEDSCAILLFDEADALFGKRSEVKDSHDRYANVEVSYLLQRMEAYSGLAILTTNLKNAIDPAFLRRIRFVVQFPFPDATERAEIWRRIFPIPTPTEGLDYRKLARLNVPGGNISNIAMNAAFLAAQACQPVRMGHILEAARIEYAKLERPMTDAELGGWN